MKNETKKIRKKILKVKYPHRHKFGNLYDEFHTFDLVDQMRMAEHDHRILHRAWDWVMNNDEMESEV